MLHSPLHLIAFCNQSVAKTVHGRNRATANRLDERGNGGGVAGLDEAGGEGAGEGVSGRSYGAPLPRQSRGSPLTV